MTSNAEFFRLSQFIHYQPPKEVVLKFIINSKPQNILLIVLLLVEMGLGLISIFITAGSSIENYAELGT